MLLDISKLCVIRSKIFWGYRIKSLYYVKGLIETLEYWLHSIAVGLDLFNRVEIDKF